MQLLSSETNSIYIKDKWVFSSTLFGTHM